MDNCNTKPSNRRASKRRMDQYVGIKSFRKPDLNGNDNRLSRLATDHVASGRWSPGKKTCSSDQMIITKSESDSGGGSDIMWRKDEGKDQSIEDHERDKVRGALRDGGQGSKTGSMDGGSKREAIDRARDGRDEEESTASQALSVGMNLTLSLSQSLHN